MESMPITDFESLRNWKPAPGDYFIRSNFRRINSFKEDENRVKTLVCHDMKGGYLSDRFRLNGHNYCHYQFWHWWQIDIFVYFSHHFITIPPTCWIEAGHKHGVKVLGTVITEWTTGEKMCSEFLKSENNWKIFADKLVQVCSFFQFDGWLLNIENKLRLPQVSTMIKFVRYLTDKQKKQVPGSMVIWYDSVTVQGKLLWQNELNSKNYAFFESCDGIFLNYTWDTKNLDKTAFYAGEKKKDVFVGIDVFSSEIHCIEDGSSYYNISNMKKFNLGPRERSDDHLDVASCAKLIVDRGMSLAIFAPGWTHEVLGDSTFLKNENKFWAKLSQYSSGRKIASLPVASTFSLGYGECFYFNGRASIPAKSEQKWSNISLQSLQPVYNPNFTYCTDTGSFGGGCLRVSCSTDERDRFITSVYKLFDTDIVQTPICQSIEIRWHFIIASTMNVNLALLFLLNPEKQSETPRYYCLTHGSIKNIKEPFTKHLNKNITFQYSHISPPRFSSVSQKLYDAPWNSSAINLKKSCGVLQGVYIILEPTSNDNDASLPEMLLGFLEIKYASKDISFLNKYPKCMFSFNFDNKRVTVTRHGEERLSRAENVFRSLDIVLYNSVNKTFTKLDTLHKLRRAVNINEPLYDMEQKNIKNVSLEKIYLRWGVGNLVKDEGEFYYISVQNLDGSVKYLDVSPTRMVEITHFIIGKLTEVGELTLEIRQYVS